MWHEEDFFFCRKVGLVGSVWLGYIMGVEGVEGGEVIRSNLMKNFLEPKVKECVLDFEGTLQCKA